MPLKIETVLLEPLALLLFLEKQVEISVFDIGATIAQNHDKAEDEGTLTHRVG